MSQEQIIEAQERVKAGTGPARAVRREGMVPGIIYGDKKDPQMIAVDTKSLVKEVSQTGFFSKVYTLNISGKSQRVIAKDIHMHPVTDMPLHVDFLRINKDSKVQIFVPVNFINEEKSPALKMGGALNIIVHNLEIQCPADAIPQSIDIDLTGLEMHQSITLDVVKLPKGAKAAHADRDNVIATVVAPSGSAAEEETKTEAAEA